jgi:hypothetical protein
MRPARSAAKPAASSVRSWRVSWRARRAARVRGAIRAILRLTATRSLRALATAEARAGGGARVRVTAHARAALSKRETAAESARSPRCSVLRIARIEGSAAADATRGSVGALWLAGGAAGKEDCSIRAASAARASRSFDPGRVPAGTSCATRVATLTATSSIGSRARTPRAGPCGAVGCALMPRTCARRLRGRIPRRRRRPAPRRSSQRSRPPRLWALPEFGRRP